MNKEIIKEYIRTENDGALETLKESEEKQRGRNFNIQEYTNKNNIKHAWALLEQPEVLSIRHRNHFTDSVDVPIELGDLIASGVDNSVEIENFINQQDSQRGIHYRDYYQ